MSTTLLSFEYETSEEAQLALDELQNAFDNGFTEEEVDPYIFVMGLDPGGTTGVAMVRVDTRDEELNPELIYLHQIPDGRYGFKDWFADSVIEDNVIIVSEKWRERHIKGADREPMYIEGGIHMLWGDENVVYQTPDYKELVPDEWLVENNLWTENGRHQMDALKHVFAYLRNDGHSATVKSLAGESDEPMAEPGAAENAQLEQGESHHEATSASEGQSQGENGPGSGSSAEAEDEEELSRRTARKRNGVFAGFNPVEWEETQMKTLFED